jgi:hypothetical protein
LSDVSRLVQLSVKFGQKSTGSGSRDR